MDEKPHNTLRVERWPSETPLFALVVLVALGIWVLLALSIVGMIYAVMIGLFLLISHLMFIAYLRGSAVKLGPEQMPELYGRVCELSRQVGLRKVPDVYVMQAGGALNALATRFLATNFVVLFSDLLEACGEDTEARDMVIGHELGHLKEGHLAWIWILAPGLFVPFLGTAYSRAREYTCDRYGAAVCRDKGAAVRGLAILAAGGTYGRRINLRGLADQRADLDTGLMTIGHWLSTHPSLAHRVAALEPELAGERRSFVRGPLTALLLLGSAIVVPVVIGGLASAVLIPAMLDSSRLPTTDDPPADDVILDEDWDQQYDPLTVAKVMGTHYAREQALKDLAEIVRVVDAYAARSGRFPADTNELAIVWQALRPGEPFPADPFDGLWYGYAPETDHVRVWSIGPDSSDPSDDIRLVSNE